jgi:hypothetical protein
VKTLGFAADGTRDLAALRAVELCGVNAFTVSSARSTRAISSANVVSLSSHFSGSPPARRAHPPRVKSVTMRTLRREREHVGIKPRLEEHLVLDLVRRPRARRPCAARRRGW